MASRSIVPGVPPIATIEVEELVPTGGIELKATFSAGHSWNEIVPVSLFAPLILGDTPVTASERLGPPVARSTNDLDERIDYAVEGRHIGLRRVRGSGDSWRPWAPHVFPTGNDLEAMLPSDLLNCCGVQEAPYGQIVLMNADGSPGVLIYLTNGSLEWFQLINGGERL
jgi:hypothetical protein